MNEPFANVPIAAFLAQQRTASLATVDGESNPHAANVQFVHDDRFDFYFVSSANSAHVRHIALRPQVALTIYAHEDAPDQIHGLQIHGICGELHGDWREQALWIYAEKYPFVLTPPFLVLVERQSFFRIRPTWMRWIDNRRAFGWKEEWQEEGGGKS